MKNGDGNDLAFICLSCQPNSTLMATKGIQHILIPTDFSEVAGVALNYGLKLATLYGSKITLLHVRENYSHDVLLPNISEETNINNRYDVIARERLEHLAHEITESTGLTVNCLLTTGHIAQEIGRYHREEGVDFVVMGTHGTKGIEEFFLGSNAYRVVNSVKCPVLTVQQPVNTEFGTIVVPIDDTLHSREKLPYCVDLARKYGSVLKVLMLHREETAQHEAHMNAIAAQVEDYLTREKVNYTVDKVVSLQIAKEILRFSEYMRADLVVIMSEQEITITGMLLGPFSQQVVNHSKIPVLTIKPRYQDKVMNVSEMGSF